MSSVYRVNYQLRAHKRDALIEFIKSMLLTPFVLHAKPHAMLEPPADHAAATLGTEEGEDKMLPPPVRQRRASDAREANIARYAEIMRNVEELIEASEHRSMEAAGLREHSRLFRLVPSVGTFFTSLPLREAFLAEDANNSIAARRFVPPSFNDVRRHIRAIAPELRLITFDGDMTLYADGQDFAKDSELVGRLVALLQYDLRVAIVTAASYGSDAVGYEQRLSGLLSGFQEAGLSAERLARFFVLGGECNYLFQCGADCRLRYIPEEIYRPATGIRMWSDEHISALLDVAERNLRRCVADMHLPVRVLRKPRALGVLATAGASIRREQLHSPSQDQAALPFCAFNGGSDVWVDIGNKFIGVQMLQAYLGTTPSTTLHVGDQFLSTGNDISTRTACSTVWIVSPQETSDVLKDLNGLLELAKRKDSN
ncbi:IMP-specific 5'-nucleotidase [Thamnocephalis sphaerospora]|uniref:IMP-specific 5'-nucleotidase 1 n=1 Tax=Thamnocephalis sphaerospora TaxID=78915 RepID=A0A4P9XUL5_9FUNG|nr:IMP-specific 5'-nucleotidase [Thamnocephalis sphaerospora]|eukprot:RKP09918.1 IMP-specific 5'-nucleotidase [Thamnocephalis sphaerospora]